MADAWAVPEGTVTFFRTEDVENIVDMSREWPIIHERAVTPGRLHVSTLLVAWWRQAMWWKE